MGWGRLGRGQNRARQRWHGVSLGEMNLARQGNRGCHWIPTLPGLIHQHGPPYACASDFAIVAIGAIPGKGDKSPLPWGDLYPALLPSVAADLALQHCDMHTYSIG